MIDDLYQDILLDHARRPRGFGRPPNCDAEAEGRNPVCGDHIRVILSQRDERVEEVRFEGGGCAISQASASMMTEALAGLSVAEARETIDEFQRLMTGRSTTDASERIGEELLALSAVRRFPARVKCATLAWHALRRSLDSASA